MLCAGGGDGGDGAVARHDHAHPRAAGAGRRSGRQVRARARRVSPAPRAPLYAACLTPRRAAQAGRLRRGPQPGARGAQGRAAGGGPRAGPGAPGAARLALPVHRRGHAVPGAHSPAPHPTPSPLTLRGACSRSCSCGRAWLASWMGWTSSSTTRRCRCAAHSRRRWPPPPPRPEEPPPRPTPPRRCSNEGDGSTRRASAEGTGLARRSGHTRRVLVMWGWRARGVSAAAAAGARSLPRRGRRCQRGSHDGRKSSVHCKQDPFSSRTPKPRATRGLGGAHLLSCVLRAGDGVPYGALRREDLEVIPTLIRLVALCKHRPHPLSRMPAGSRWPRTRRWARARGCSRRSERCRTRSRTAGRTFCPSREGTRRS